MNIKVEAVHFDADKKLVDFINEKVKKLDHFYDHIIGGEVFLKLDKPSEKGNKIAEIKIEVPGKDLFAKKQSHSFEEATDLCVDALKRQVEKHKIKFK